MFKFIITILSLVFILGCYGSPVDNDTRHLSTFNPDIDGEVFWVTPDTGGPVIMIGTELEYILNGETYTGTIITKLARQ